LISMGVKVEEALAWVYDFLGWGEPKLSKSGRTLADDLQEFIDLLPLDDILAIAAGLYIILEPFPRCPKC
jgi:hypothetical protein